jgi:hypothetical protein
LEKGKAERGRKRGTKTKENVEETHLSDHPLYERLLPVHHPIEVNRKRLLPALQVPSEALRRYRHSSVQKQKVDLPLRLVREVGQRLHVLRIAHVRHAGRELFFGDTGGDEVVGSADEGFGRDVGEDEGEVEALSEELCDGGTDSAGSCAGDDGDVVADEGGVGHGFVSVGGEGEQLEG